MFIFLPATLDNICGGDIIGEGLSVSQIKISRICKSLVLFIIVFGSMNGGFMLNICNININIPNIWTCFIEHSFSVPFLFSQPSWLVLYGPTKSQQKDTYRVVFLTGPTQKSFKYGIGPPQQEKMTKYTGPT